MRKSIPTRYNGILFRSKLEADWARTFDALGIEWQFEPEGHYFGNVFYLPDFYLPRSGQWVEVKPAYQRADLEKVRALCSHVRPWKFRPDSGPDVCLIAASPEGWFHGWPRGPADDVEITELGLDLVLHRCVHCTGWWFAVDQGDYRCRCCGTPDCWVLGPRPRFVGCIEGFPLAPQKAA